MNLVPKKIYGIGFSIFSISIGGGLLFQTVGDMLTVGADSLVGNKQYSGVLELVVLVLGVILIASGVLSSILVLSTISKARYEKSA